MAQIHPSAIVDSAAELADDVQIGPYALIEGNVRLGAGCKVAAMSVLKGTLEVGENCYFGHHCVIGEVPQDRSFNPQTPSGVRIGKGNVLREFVSIHRGSQENSWTTVGDDNFLMGGAHLAHDVQLGSHNNLANNVLLAGFVEVGDRCFLGGGAVVHQFVRLGDGCLLQGNAGMSVDVAPFSIGANINELAGINSIGLKRSGFCTEERKELRRLWKYLLRNTGSLEKLIADLPEQPQGAPAKTLIEFCLKSAQAGHRGIMRKA